MQKNKPDYYNDLDKVYLKIWKLLKIGLQNIDIPFHIPAFTCGDKAPGFDASEATSGLSADFDNLKYTKEESEIGYKNFCVIETFINSIEWLYLAAKGHRRAYFSLKNNSLEKKWLIP